MRFHISFLSKWFSADLTAVRFLSSMDSLMFDHVGRSVEHLTTEAAVVDFVTVYWNWVCRSWNNKMSHIIRKPVYAICEQQRRRSACVSAQYDQHISCSLPRKYNISSFYIGNFILASFCSWADRFEFTWPKSRRQVLSWRDSNKALTHGKNKKTQLWKTPWYFLLFATDLASEDLKCQRPS